jgi:hypothetical protein
MKVDKRPTPQPAGKAAEQAPAKAAAPKEAAPAIARDAVVVKTTTDDTPAQAAPKPEEKKSLFKKFVEVYFGNTENKLFMLKFNSLHFKEKVLSTLNAVESGPIAKVVDFAKGGLAKLGALKSAVFGKLAAAGGEAGFFSKAMGKVGKVGGVAFKFMEKAAPFFGWLVAGQDAVGAVKSYNDPKSSGLRRGLLTATAGFSIVGAAASTVALSAAAMAAVGVSAPLLGGVAIACFAGSLLTGWLASRQKAKEA